MTKTATARSAHPADETDIDEVMRRFKEDQASKSLFKPKTPGDYYHHILPPKEKGLFYRKFGMHYGLQYVSTKFGETKGVACLKKTLDQDCPLCELWSKWKFEAYLPGGKVNAERKEMSYEIRPSERYVMNIRLKDGNVMLWDVPKPTYELIMNVFSEEGDITNPKTGRMVKATLSQKGDFTIWSSVIASTKGGIEGDDWREKRLDLEAYATNRLWDYERLSDIVGPLLSGDEAPRRRAEPEPQPEPEVETEEAETVTETEVQETELVADLGDVKIPDDDPDLQALLAKYQGKKRK